VITISPDMSDLDKLAYARIVAATLDPGTPVELRDGDGHSLRLAIAVSRILDLNPAIPLSIDYTNDSDVVAHLTFAP